ncbi:SRPBCC family protein [Sciscionella marina]|uniref:SRPBCC family protein n=1 Tax=Sciscionella marina TaxID=508770 RepID=UPI000374F173|nr:SRPBCC family protein [Sciscionella marina]
MSEDLGTLHSQGDAYVLRFERTLRHPVEKVWRAVTEPAEMAHWFPAQVRTELRAGAAMRFAFDGHFDLGERFGEGKVLEYDPPKVYAFRWAHETFRIELIPHDSGCVLVFSTTLPGTDTTCDFPSVARTAPGWHECLDALLARLDGASAPQPREDFDLPLIERYVERFGLAEGTGTATGIRFERDLMHGHEKVWASLTEGTDPEPGDQPPLPATHGYLTPGPVTEAEPRRVLEYTCGTGRVRFELRDQEPIGCRLVLTQTAPEDRAAALAAWQTHLELLVAALHGDIRCPWPSERTEQLRERYARTLS